MADLASLPPSAPPSSSPSWLGLPPTHAGWWADAVVLLAVMGVGAALVASLLPQTTRWELPATWNDLRTGRATAALEKKWEQALPGRDGIIAAANSVRYLLLHGGGAQVLVGNDGWLFLRDELRAWPSTWMERRIERIAMVTQSLHRQGIPTTIALVPDKARLYADTHYWAGYPEALRPRYAQALQALRAAGIHAIDLLAPLQAAANGRNGGNGAEVYYRTDTHWNQIGARVAAQALSTAIAQAHRLPNRTAFVTTTSATQSERPGDLIRLMGLENAPAWARPEPDREYETSTSPQQSATADDLFGDNAAPCMLAGTSYSLRGNFAGHLQQALSAQVLNFATDGAGLWRAMGDLLQDDSFRTTPPQCMIWEIPERLLVGNVEGEEGDWIEITKNRIINHPVNF